LFIPTTTNTTTILRRALATMSTIKPIDLHGAHGPNPQKVRLILSDLDLPHTIHEVSFADVKGPAFTALNPNGRMPAIHDPNNDFTLWESGAILEYITDKYDVDRKLSFEPGSKEAYLAKQWLYFQSTFTSVLVE
jgi:glutathione S-transferase